ncbi:MAG: hypothetical protein EOO50_16300, partial [Flavobacterium sp.]|uniref:hypothetical protein n=1 Tax=Flavobacterium sp. TaxID=239 RepID=UPI0012150733
MFKGDINSFRRYEAINLIVIVEILVFFALIVFSRTFAIASVIIAITSIIWVLLKIRPDENTLIFDNSDFVHINKHTKTRYGYDSIAKVTFSNPPRHQKSITIVLT